jgi:hypothetical protein
MVFKKILVVEVSEARPKKTSWEVYNSHDYNKDNDIIVITFVDCLYSAKSFPCALLLTFPYIPWDRCYFTFI